MTFHTKKPVSFITKLQKTSSFSVFRGKGQNPQLQDRNKLSRLDNHLLQQVSNKCARVKHMITYFAEVLRQGKIRLCDYVRLSVVCTHKTA